MKFRITEAKSMYREMFGESLERRAIDAAKRMSEKEFNDNQPGCSEDGDYLPSEFSAGEWDCIDAAR